MGALTFKNSAFNSRPWELTKVEAPDLFDGKEDLTLYLRGSTVVKINSRGWLRDRVRFSYDGFRRQRLVQPLAGGEPVPWSLALTHWWNLIYNRPVKLVIDSTHCYSFWLQLLLRRLSFLHPAGRTYAIDQNVSCRLYQGSYGLEVVRLAELALPVQFPYEEGGLLRLDVPGFQSFAFGLSQFFFLPPIYRARRFTPLYFESTSPRIALFQVSPLQRFLAG